MAQLRPSDEYELLPRASLDSSHSSDTESGDYKTPNSKKRRYRCSWQLRGLFPLRLVSPILIKARHCLHLRREHRHRIYWTVAVLPGVMLLLIFFVAIFHSSYSNPPEHYKVLEKRCKDSRDPGRGNVNDEKILIAASLYDHQGELLGGDWGTAVIELVQLLGPKNVHLSVYENDPDDLARIQLEKLGTTLDCNISLVSEHLPLEEIPRVTVPTGGKRMKRIAFLAEVRNRALRPLDDLSIRFDKLLFINDIMFNPIEAIQLLFSTNIDSNGRAQYGAACAVDFINPFKFYDRFATRDLEGYEMGIPFYPWFTNAGNSASRNDVLAQKDAVRVRACWGGMTAFEASWFQKKVVESPSNVVTSDSNKSAKLQLSPLRFRYEKDPFWDASECCLIHADLSHLRHGLNVTVDSGIYTNPYVRVAYDSKTLFWLPYTRRIERLYSIVHGLLNRLVGLPGYNPRRLEQPGDRVIEKVWRYDKEGNAPGSSNLNSRPKGSYHNVKRIADPGRFCGNRVLLVLNDDAKEGEKKWIKVPLPLPPS